VEPKKVFAEDFHKDIFFVLVCGSFLLIVFFFSGETARDSGWAAGKVSMHSYCNH